MDELVVEVIGGWAAFILSALLSFWLGRYLDVECGWAPTEIAVAVTAVMLVGVVGIGWFGVGLLADLA